MPGFYQNVKGSCIKIFEEIPDIPEEEYTNIAKILAFVLVLVLY